MKIKLHLFFTSFLISSLTINCANAQCVQGSVTTFQKVFGGNGNERGHSVIQTSDGGYAVVGETTSFGAGSSDFFILKIDANGVSQWTKTYGGSAKEDGVNIGILQTASGGYIIHGYTESFGAGNTFDSYVLRLDNSGNIIWEKRIGGNGFESFRDVVELPSGEIILTGNTNSLTAGGDHDFHVVKLSSIGNIIWSKTYGGAGGISGFDQSVGLMVTASGSIYVTGVTDTYSIGILDGFMIKLDGNGNVIWQKTVGGSNYDGLYNSIILNDGNILTTCLTEFSSGGRDVLVSKLDTNGNLIWAKAYGGVQDEYGINLKQRSNNEIIVSANTLSFGNGQQMMLFSIDSLGNVNWAKTYGSVLIDETERWGLPMDLTSDGGMIFTGTTTNFGAVGQDVYLIKTNGCGDSYCNEQNIIPLNVITPPITMVNTNVSLDSGLIALNTNTLVSTISFTENYQCIDSIQAATPCNLTANFSGTSFCLGDSTVFTDLSIDSVGTIVNWQWYFGDGDSIIGVQNPAHLYSSTGNYNVVLVVTNDSNCVDSITIPITINPVFNMNRNDTICQGDSILLGGSFQTTTGNYVDSLQSVFGCDSIVNTNLIVNPVFSSTQNSTICQGDSLLFNGNFYSIAGVYNDSLQTVSGCDSLLTLNLTVNPSFQFNQTQTICSGDSIFLAGGFQSTAGIYTDSLQTVLSCDSLINTTLIVGNNYNDTIAVSICQGDSILLGGNFQTLAGNYIDSLPTIIGCDSVVVSLLSIDTVVNLIVSNDTTVSPCHTVQLFVTGGSTYLWSPSSGLSCVNCANPTVFPTITTTYFVTDISNSCSSNNSVTITVEGVSDFFIPNVFTPNGDDNNDGFNVKSSCIFSLEKKIYNRWGELLFESIQINEVWDGRTRAGEEVPEGTYFYIIQVGMYQNNEEIIETFTGTVSLLR